MPILKSARKRMRQNAVRRARNYPLRSEMKTYFKNVLNLIKKGNADDAAKMLPKAFSVIDMAVKRNIIHENNGARKKSRLARELNQLQQGGAAAKAPEVKKETKKEEKAEEAK